MRNRGRAWHSSQLWREKARFARAVQDKELLVSSCFSFPRGGARGGGGGGGCSLFLVPPPPQHNCKRKTKAHLAKTANAFDMELLGSALSMRGSAPGEYVGHSQHAIFQQESVGFSFSSLQVEQKATGTSGAVYSSSSSSAPEGFFWGRCLGQFFLSSKAH